MGKIPVSITSGKAHPLRMRVGSMSLCGLRMKNDDYCVASPKRDLFAISDGIGGAPYGDVISRVACNCALESYERHASLNKAFADANEVSSRVSRYLREGSGATLLLAAVEDGRLSIAWVGDSVCYRLRSGRLELLTRPGRLSSASNALDKAVGYGETACDRVDTDIEAMDRLLLCTDGVWEPLSEDHIATLLATGENAPMIADRIANEGVAHGTDNATCMVILVDEDSGGAGLGSHAASGTSFAARTPNAWSS